MELKTGASARRSLLIRLATAVACGALYAIVLAVFANVDFLNNEYISVRPASGLSPILGLFCGAPGILGCSAANLFVDLLETSDPALLGQWFCIQLVYNGLPYLAWYAIFRKAKNPFPCIDSATKMLVFVVLAVADSFLAAALLMPTTTDELGMAQMSYAINNILFTIYLGIPLLVALDRTPLVPLAPIWIKSSYTRREYLNLTQRFAFALTLMAFGIVVAYSVSWLKDVFVNDYASDLLITSSIVIYSVMTSALGISGAILLPTILFLFYIERCFTLPIERLTRASRSFVKALSRHELEGKPLIIKHVSEKGLRVRFEMRDLFESTFEMASGLADYIDRLTTATAERERTQAELDIAHQIQEGSVPHDFEEFSERYSLDVAACMIPARDVGGDFYDAIDLGGNAIVFVIADVSGKGIASALFMMRAQSLIRQTMLTLHDPGMALNVVNNQLCHNNDSMLFVTAFVCVLDLSQGTFSYANAGHNPIQLRHMGERGYLHAKPGMVLGAIKNLTYTTQTMPFFPGDSILLYTDGVNEAQDKTNELFGNDRLEAALTAADELHLGAKDSVDAVRAAVRSFAAGAPQADDITMTCVDWNLPTKRAEVAPQVGSLDEVNDFLQSVCTQDGMGPHMLVELRLVMEELFVNVCNYGFEGTKTADRPKVVLLAAVDPKNARLYLAMIDEGVPYDPCSFEPTTLADDPNHRIGGLGILLARKYTSSIRYERLGNKNVLYIVKDYA